ncbi:hypothetical protein GCM10007368_31240 [Isoptericola cucumis]|uniref:DUF3800 domain-containing protein n=1 Tax=Isoptericola cucumis TaxID=1776856 RepID=A0ABQ2BBX7_9MICO|nr:hypothetical protein [Isoptericola cucumis]GGI10438.1 hypothetical protein GCM10007368_31240 [Isoptericola cucumis]
MDTVEIACDESGFSGTNLLDPRSPVIAHGSVDLTPAEAAEVLAVLRSRFGHRRTAEHKAHLLLRPGQLPALEWFLAELDGRAHVHVVDKRAFVAARVVELFAHEPSYTDGTRLGRDHRAAVAALRPRTDLLEAFVALTHLKHRRLVDPVAVDRFLGAVPDDVPDDVPELRAVTRSRVEAVLARLVDGDPAIPPPLEPLVPAVAETVLAWSAGRRSVAVVHDEQSALTPQRTARLAASLAQAVAPAPPPLLGVRQVDSRHDPRVQVADLLAGAARQDATRQDATRTASGATPPAVTAGASRRSADGARGPSGPRTPAGAPAAASRDPSPGPGSAATRTGSPGRSPGRP